MSSWRTILLLSLAAFSSVSCLSKRIVDVRNDILLSQPLWESSQVMPTALIAASDEVRGALAVFPTSLNVLATERPGLAMVIRQVFREDIQRAAARAVDAGKPFNTTELEKLVRNGTEDLLGDSAPLPEDLAGLPVAKLIAGTAYRQAVASFGVQVKDAPKMPEKLSLQNFYEFAEAVSRSLLLPYQSTDNALKSGRADKLRACRKTGKIAFECLFSAYMVAYFNGSFVDKNGGTYSKPKIGVTITNETISSVIDIFIEALFDVTIINARGIRAPIIYTVDKTQSPPKAVWLTKDKKQPTLVDVAIALKLADPPATGFANIIELADADTMDAPRLCVARFLGGAAGDAAQPLVGLIVRMFGGANLGAAIGLGALGKFSFGDNDTLTKVVDTVVEKVPRRFTEASVQHALYGKSGDTPGIPEGLRNALAVAGWVCK